MRINYLNVILILIVIAFQGCYGIRPSSGGGEAETLSRQINPLDIALPKGYSIEALSSGLTFPTGITFDEQGQIYLVESGYSYGEAWSEPRLLKIDPSGKTSVIATGEKNGPWNGVTFKDGNFYIAEGGALNGGKILKVSKEGKISALIENLPSKGDHHTNGPIVWNGYVYFGLGTATNSGVVGEDNASFGWLERNPDFHDIPCEDVVLSGRNYESNNVLTENPDDKATTGAFVSFNTKTEEGQVVKGTVPCSGSVLRISTNGGAPELVAWGFRNPFGLAVYEGKLFVTDNGFDDRGSRPVWGTGDILWEVKENQWYGWPDYSGHHALNEEVFKVPGKGAAELLLKEKPNEPPHPIAELGVHSSSNGMDFSISDEFGYKGKVFIAQLGDMAPNVGKVMGPVGFKVVMVDVERGVIRDFAVNKGKKNGPASKLEKGGLERPVGLKFSPDGKSLYVVDFGIIEISDGKTISHKETGMLWKITKQ
ncbi:MAG: glucose dehydrogenase [Bacteroidota bacterium]|nr:glucose dehydrogenase [Bacteroidota bacterium]